MIGGLTEFNLKPLKIFDNQLKDTTLQKYSNDDKNDKIKELYKKYKYYVHNNETAIKKFEKLLNGKTEQEKINYLNNILLKYEEPNIDIIENKNYLKL